MKKWFFALLLCQSFAFAQSSHIVISQVYGGGGNSGAPFTHDFVELFNPTSSTVSLNGWSLQCAAPGGSGWSNSKLNLSGSIEPGHYFLIQLDGGTTGAALPIPDLTLPVSYSINISATSGGKVALVNSTNVLSGDCPLGNSIIDFVGYSTATCYETSLAGATTAKTAVIRVNNGCTDTDNNSADFKVGTPSPRNSASPANFCNSGSVIVNSIFSAPFCVDATNSASGTIQFTATGNFTNTTFKALLSDANGSFAAPVTIGTADVSGTNPSADISIAIPARTLSSLNYRIRVDAVNPSVIGTQSGAFEVINGAKNVSAFKAATNTGIFKLTWTNPVGCFDEVMIVAKEGTSINGVPTGDGSAYSADLNFNGSGSVFDGGRVVYKGTTSGQTISGFTDGKSYYFKAYTRRGFNWSAGIEVFDKSRSIANPGEILINQMSPQFGSNASDEYIELVNTTGKTFDLSELAIRYQATTGNKAPGGGTLSGTLAPHGYWLLASSMLTTITVGKTNNLVADGSFAEGFAAGGGQIALIRNTDLEILDGVGYGAIAGGTYTEGASTVIPSSNGGLKRKTDGVDNNNNSLDFIIVANADIELRNSQSRLANTNASIAAGNYKTIFVTGNAQLSGDVSVIEKVVLLSGKFSLNNNNLTAENIIGGSDAAYIQTNASGSLTINNITTYLKTFPVGNSTYNPVSITNGSGLSWTVKVTDDIAFSSTPFTKSKAVNRTWNVAPSATPIVGATVTFEFNDSDHSQTGTAYIKGENVQLWNYHQNTWLSAGPIQTPVSSNGMKKVTLANQTQFSPFVIADPSVVLPVHFTNLKGFSKSSGNQIEFTNSTESDVQFYLIERSLDGQHFIVLTQLQPKLNNGNAASYVYTDATANNKSYYRIKAVEVSGNIIYSTIIGIAQKGFEDVVIAPNVIANKTLNLQASLPKGIYKMQVVNSSGHVVYRQPLQQNGSGNFFQSFALPSTLQAGHYILQIVGEGKHFQKPFILAQ